MQVTDAVYADFKRFAQDEMRTGGLKPEAVYAPQLANLEKSFVAAKVNGCGVLYTTITSFYIMFRTRLRMNLNG